MRGELFDITIIGAGPSGLFCAFYAGLRGMSVKVIEALPEAGGQVTILYPEKYIYDVPGHPRILARELTKQLLEQAALFEPTYLFGERVSDLKRESAEGRDIWTLQGERETHLSKTIVIAAGIGAFAPNKLDATGVEQFEGHGVHYFVGDNAIFNEKRVLVVGGGDTAIDWCLNLKDSAKEIILIHRRDKFRAHEASVAALRASDVPIRTFWEVKEAYGNGELDRVKIFNNKTGEEDELAVDALLVNVGFKATLGPIAAWGLELADRRRIRVRGMMETNLPGVYAAGDVAAVEGIEPLELLVTGFGQAAIAANAARNYTDPDKKASPGHSSDLTL